MWHQRAVINYEQQYIAIYIAYNTWYSLALQTTNDRQALQALKKRYVIWDDYLKGGTLQDMTPFMTQLVELTQREPLEINGHYWNGEIGSVQDWASLIEYWYYIRCRLMHGAQVQPTYLILAYETLKCFMDEIVERIQRYHAVGSSLWEVDMVRRSNT